MSKLDMKTFLGKVRMKVRGKSAAKGREEASEKGEKNLFVAVDHRDDQRSREILEFLESTRERVHEKESSASELTQQEHRETNKKELNGNKSEKPIPLFKSNQRE